MVRVESARDPVRTHQVIVVQILARYAQLSAKVMKLTLTAYSIFIVPLSSKYCCTINRLAAYWHTFNSLKVDPDLVLISANVPDNRHRLLLFVPPLFMATSAMITINRNGPAGKWRIYKEMKNIPWHWSSSTLHFLQHIFKQCRHAIDSSYWCSVHCGHLYNMGFLIYTLMSIVLCLLHHLLCSWKWKLGLMRRSGMYGMKENNCSERIYWMCGS